MGVGVLNNSVRYAINFVLTALVIIAPPLLQEEVYDPLLRLQAIVKSPAILFLFASSAVIALFGPIRLKPK